MLLLPTELGIEVSSQTLSPHTQGAGLNRYHYSESQLLSLEARKKDA